MAVTSIADIIEPSSFTDYLLENTTTKSAYWNSGIVTNSPLLFNEIGGGGRTFNVPFWKEPNDEDQVMDEDTPITVSKFSSDKQIGTLFERANAWATKDIAIDVAGSDPMLQLGEMFTSYWARKYNDMLISQTTGILLDNVASESSDLVNDISAKVGDLAKINRSAIVQTAAKFGDSASGLAGIAMHSVPYFRLVEEDAIDFIPDSMGKLTIPTYLGLQVIVDDSMPESGGVYTSAIFKPGAFSFAERPGVGTKVVETYRSELASEDGIITRRRGILHPNGFKWVGTPTKDFPSNTEFALAANWERVFDKKNIGVAFLKSKEA